MNKATFFILTLILATSVATAENKVADSPSTNTEEHTHPSSESPAFQASENTVSPSSTKATSSQAEETTPSSPESPPLQAPENNPPPTEATTTTPSNAEGTSSPSFQASKNTSSLESAAPHTGETPKSSSNPSIGDKTITNTKSDAPSIKTNQNIQSNMDDDTMGTTANNPDDVDYGAGPSNAQEIAQQKKQAEELALLNESKKNANDLITQTESSVSSKSSLYNGDEKTSIDNAIASLNTAIESGDTSKIDEAMTALNTATATADKTASERLNAIKEGKELLAETEQNKDSKLVTSEQNIIDTAVQKLQNAIINRNTDDIDQAMKELHAAVIEAKHLKEDRERKEEEERLRKLAAEKKKATEDFIAEFKNSMANALCLRIFGGAYQPGTPGLCNPYQWGIFKFFMSEQKALNEKNKAVVGPNHAVFFNNVLNPLKPLLKIASTPRNPIQQIALQVFTQSRSYKSNSQFDQVMNQPEFTSFIFSSLLSPFYAKPLSAKDSTYYNNYYTPLTKEHILNRLQDNFGFNNYNTCINHRNSMKNNPIQYTNLTSLCEFLKPNNISFLINTLRLISSYKILQKSINGCLESQLKTNPEEIKDLDEFKGQYYISSTGTLTTSEKLYKHGCFTSWQNSSYSFRGNYPLDSFANGYYVVVQNILNLYQLLSGPKISLGTLFSSAFTSSTNSQNTSTQPISTLEGYLQQNPAAHQPSIQALNQLKSSVKAFKFSPDNKSLPTISNLAPNKATPLLKQIQTDLNALDNIINPSILQWFSQTLTAANHPDVISINDVFDTASFYNMTKTPGESTLHNDPIQCSSPIGLSGVVLESSGKESSNSYYSRQIIHRFLKQLGELKKMPKLYTTPLNAKQNLLNIYEEDPLHKNHYPTMAAGLSFNIDTIHNKGPSIADGDSVVQAGNPEILSQYKLNQKKFYNEIYKKSFHADTLGFVSVKTASLAVISQLAASRDTLYQLSCGKQTFQATPMEILYHNASFRTRDDTWFKSIQNASDKTFLLKEMNFLLAEEREMKTLLRRQQEMLIGVLSNWITTNQSSSASSDHQSKTIIDHITSYGLGTSETMAKKSRAARQSQSANSKTMPEKSS
ncbi:MAG TPA: hypothetical protein QF353_03505 [Gammaproteobacteria bacterium]|nr:hypothetical protein [Gammaproteobacteria bacterium]